MMAEIITATAVKALVENIVKEIITPKIKQFCNRLSLEYDKKLVPTAEHFSEYLVRTYDKYSIANTLVLRNHIKKLKNIYVPLTLENKENADNVERQVIDGFPKDFFVKNTKLLITDTAGMGKSTMIKRMFLDVIDKGYGIPIFVELRRINETHNLLAEIESQLSSLTQEFNHTLMLELFKSGGFIFFFDGCDEIPIVDRAFTMHDVESFIDKACANTFIVTSRPDEVLNSFGSFKRMSIKGLNQNEAFDLLRKYDDNGSVSAALIKKLRDKQYKMITEFLENPLLVSLLFIAFDYKPTIPVKKQAFYRQVFDALFENHDLSKGDSYSHEKRSRLNSDDFEKILRRIGYECQKKQQVEFLKTDILSIIDKAQSSYVNISFASSDLLKDLLTSVPLFCQDGNYYKWAHKSLQEYFAALFISIDSKNSQEKILKAIYNSKNIQRYINLLDLYFDIDPNGFQRYILIPLLEEFVSYYDQLSVTSPNIPKHLIDVRLGLLFGHDILLGDRNEISHIKGDLMEYFKGKYGFIFDRLTLVNLGYYIADAFHKQAYIVDLLKNKVPTLFGKHKMSKLNTIPKESILVSGIDTMSESVEEFERLNCYISNLSDKLYLDINHVRDYLSKLKSVIEAGFDVDDLCDGL